MVHDDFLDGKITLEGVLRTIGIELENLKKEEWCLVIRIIIAIFAVNVG